MDESVTTPEPCGTCYGLGMWFRPCPECGANKNSSIKERTALTEKTSIWLIIEFEANSGIHRVIAAYAKEENARACASRLVGTTGKYYSLQSMEIKDAE